MRISERPFGHTIIKYLICLLVAISLISGGVLKEGSEKKGQDSVSSGIHVLSYSSVGSVGSVATTTDSPIDLLQDTPALINVAKCESGLTQFRNGEVLRGVVNHNDIGIFQINTQHEAEAKKLGYDIYTLKGNIAYAQYLYKKNGLSDWRFSEGCWGQTLSDR